MFQVESRRVKIWGFPEIMENDNYRALRPIQPKKLNSNMRNLLIRTTFYVWAKVGGPLKAYVESVPVEITDGKLLITFTSNVENSEINGIEVITQI